MNKQFSLLTAASIAALLIAAAFLPRAANAEDWPMWGRSPDRHMNSPEKTPPTEWEVPSDTNPKGTNIKWVATLGSQSYANPVVAGGLVFMGTNNEAKRDPKITEDAGVLMIFDEATGKFLWQRISPKLKSGRVNDWPYQGICSTVCAEGDYIWFCTNRCEVVCLDVSPLRNHTGMPKEVWVNDMMATLGVFPHNMTASSPTYFEDLLYVMTANGVDEAHKNVLSPNAPGLVCFNKKTGKVVWSDNSPGKNVLHGQWSSVTIATINGVTQVIAPMGDAWVRSFEARTGKLLWKFDANLKDTVYPTTRNELIATPIVEGNIMYLANGQDPEHGEGVGHLWAIDITKESNGGDVSKELPNPDAQTTAGQELMADRTQIKSKGIPNPNSAVVWDFERLVNKPNVKSSERMNRTISTVAVADGMVYSPDFSGYLHCFDAKTGTPLWTFDTESAMWGSPMICDGKLYLANEAGDVFIIAVERTTKPNVLAQINMGSACYCSPVFANGVLYISTRDKLYAIEQKK